MENDNLSPCTDDFYSYYTSAPTSPRRHDLNGFFFLSMPTSPTRDPPGLRTLNPTGDFLNLVDNFEFEESKMFYHCNNGSEKSQELSMAYADELFLDGKMLPLRPPPRTDYAWSKGKSCNSSTASSPGTRSSLKKVPFLRQKSLWNDKYDPFLSALNKVREEKTMVGKRLEVSQLRRAKSLSPLRLADNKLGLNPYGRMDLIGPWEKEQCSSNGSISEPNEKIGKFEPNETRRQRIKNYLVKNASFGKSEKKDQNVFLLLRKLNYSVRFSSVTPKTIVKISKQMKSLMKHKARICFSLTKGLRTMCTTNLS